MSSTERSKNVYDVCVVGSGPGGGICAYALSTAGLKTVLVEAGPRLRPGFDYAGHAAPFQKLDERLAAKRSPWLSVTDFSDRNHFVPVGNRPGHGQLRALGGRSLCWAGHSLRFGPGDFRSWPVRYEEVAPYYDKAERLMCVHGERNGLWNMPDGVFQKPVPLRCPELALKRGAERLKMKGRAMEFVAQRKAMPTEQHPGQRAKCHYCGHCMWGCEVDAKYTSANTPIPLGLKTGNLTVLTESMMTRVLMTRDESRVEGIEYRTSDGLTKQIKARALVLSCSAVETARHLLINGIGNSSGQVGRNLASHFGLTVVASFPELRNRRFSNDDGTDYFHSLLTGLYWDKPNPRFSGTYQVQCGAGLHPLKPSIRWAPGYGSLLKRELRELNLSHSAMNMQGSLLASEKKFVDLDAERKDKFGLPLPRVHLHYEDSDVAMAHDMIETCEELIRAAGGEVLSSPGKATVNKLEIDSNHWVGTCRMGNDPRTSVVDKFGRTHDVPNLFIGDASVFGLYPEKNPTLTNIALSWRMSDHLAELFRRKEIA